MGEAQFGGRLKMLDGKGEIDLYIDIDTEWVSLLQGDELLGRYPLRDVQFVRMSKNRVSMSFAGESADFYPLRPEEFISVLTEARQD